MLDILNTTRQNPPHITQGDFVFIKETILGKKYDLSLVFIGDKKSKKLNSQFRKKDYVPNILSFPIDKDSGEIFINLKKAISEAKNFATKDEPQYEWDMNSKNYVKFLFIHGCLHLTGLDHGKKMEKLEEKFSKKFLS